MERIYQFQQPLLIQSKLWIKRVDWDEIYRKEHYCNFCLDRISIQASFIPNSLSGQNSKHVTCIAYSVRWGRKNGYSILAPVCVEHVYCCTFLLVSHLTFCDAVSIQIYFSFSSRYETHIHPRKLTFKGTYRDKKENCSLVLIIKGLD